MWAYKQHGKNGILLIEGVIKLFIYATLYFRWSLISNNSI